MADAPETKSIVVTKAVHDYAVAHGTPPDAVQESLIAATAALGGVSRMQIAPEQGTFMTLLTKLVDARFAVEVGTFTGYSSICIARGLADGGRLLCCDVSEEWTAVARDALAAGRASTTASTCASGRPPTRCARCPADQAIDIAFIDADKTGYRTYYEEIVARLRPGGLVLARQRAVERQRRRRSRPERRHRGALRAVNDHVAGDERVESVMLPIADGLTIARKR